MVYLNERKVKQFVHSLGMQINKEAMRCLDDRIESLILQAKRNANGNKRIMKEDISLAK